MKTIKILTATILLLVAASTFAQGEKDLFATVKYAGQLTRFETWVSGIHGRIGHHRQTGTDLPVISRTFYSDEMDVSYEKEDFIESWMAIPFEAPFSEDDLIMEAWMSQPFETDELSDAPILEEWMITPFETEELIPVEAWMTASNWL
jgi:hypothetical protein